MNLFDDIVDMFHMDLFDDIVDNGYYGWVYSVNYFDIYKTDMKCVNFNDIFEKI